MINLNGSFRAILVERCDVMRAMLNGDFREANANIVSSSNVVGKMELTFYAPSDRSPRSHGIHVPQTTLLHLHR